MLISGRADGICPSTELADLAVKRMRSAGLPHRRKHLSYEDAGHDIGWRNGPTTAARFQHRTTGKALDSGGSVRRAPRASRHSWPRMLDDRCAALGVDKALDTSLGHPIRSGRQLLSHQVANTGADTAGWYIIWPNSVERTEETCCQSTGWMPEIVPFARSK